MPSFPDEGRRGGATQPSRLIFDVHHKKKTRKTTVMKNIGDPWYAIACLNHRLWT